MPGLRRTKAKELPRLGETPAEARKNMGSSDGAVVEQPKGMEVEGELQPQHLAVIEAAEGGFRPTEKSDGPAEELENLSEPPSPEKAMEVIQQLSQDKNQLQAELDVAFSKIERYRRQFGDID